MMGLAKHSPFIFIFLLFNSYAAVAQAQALNNKGKIKIANSMLWADSIEYDNIEKKIIANGRVRIYIKNKDGIDILFSDEITYNEKNGIIRAKGGRFNLQKGLQKEGLYQKNNQNGDGLLRLQSNYLIFFQNIAINQNTSYIKGENISLRQLRTNGGFTARRFETKQRKNKKEDWVFYKTRYTKCPICADKEAKAELKNKNKNISKNKKIKKKLFSIPLWRIDASKIHFENFTNENKGSLKPSARVHMHNARINIYGVPVFYTPYFSYPRFGQRASGLLAPTYSLGGVNGYSISLPIFWAPHKSFDATYIPKFTTTEKDTSRIELRSAFAFGGLDTEKLNKKESPKGNKHLISFTTGASVPHAEIGSGGQAKFLAYARATWLAPKGLRAHARYHFIGQRNYLYEYGQGVGILSQYAPPRLQDLARIEHFSRNGHANILLQQQRELYYKPRADALLLPEITYENAGTFAVNKRGNSKWAASALWRGAVRKKQNSFAEIGIPQSENLRQDLLNGSIAIGWHRYLGAGFYGNADAKIAINYWQQKLGTIESSQWQILPEAQIGIEGLFANSYNKGATILYLKPMLEIYSTLQDLEQNLEQNSREQLNGQVQFYDEQKRIGQQKSFATALDGGQRLLAGVRARH